MAYPVVTIHNCTNYRAYGQVNYSSAFCSNDKYDVTANDTWKAGGRGACLLTSITATLVDGDSRIDVTSYKSSGTSYSQFAIIGLPNGKFAVTRVTDGAEDIPPNDYVEPTSDQKTTCTIAE